MNKEQIFLLISLTKVISLLNNKFTNQSESIAYKLFELLKQRDPLSKTTSGTNNPDGDTVSVQSGKESSLGRNQKLSAKH